MALFPDAATLEQLICNGARADQCLHWAFEMLASVRGAAVELTWSRLLGHMPDGTLVALEQRRTQRIGRQLADGNCRTNPARSV